MRRPMQVLVAVAVVASGFVAASAAQPRPAAAATCQISPPSPDFRQQVAMSAGHAQVWRMYQGFFLRQPDEQGLSYWYGVRARGAGLGDIAYSFSTSEEFRRRYGALSHGQFVDLVYRNVLCRTPDAGGRSYWTDLLRTGALSRWNMVVNFVELREYLGRTGTCHSIYPGESAAVAACATQVLRPLSQATMASDGYQAHHIAVARARGGIGSFRAVEVDWSRGIFEAGTDRCAVASINANWVLESEKDRPNPTAIGLGVVDGVHVKGSADRTDRGVLGLRFDASPKSVVEVWPGDTLSPDDQRLSSVLHHRGKASLESWLAAAELSPYLSQLAPQERVGPDEWVWAAAGMPLLIDGQVNKNFDADYARDPYTMQTLRHPFVAFDQDSGRLLFGATQDLDARDLLRWMVAAGYEDLVKFDGGASTELNAGGRAIVGGTSRDLPVWLGIGC